MRQLALAAALLLAACKPTNPDLDQLTRMRGERIAAQAAESTACTAQDRVCAQIAQLHGAASATLASDPSLAAPQRAQYTAAALRDAQALPGLLPADAPAQDQTATEYTIFLAWRVALDNASPAATAPALAAAAAGLNQMPGGADFGATLTAYGQVNAVLTGRVATAAACPSLAAAAQQLPADTAAPLAAEIALLRGSITSAQATRCSS